MRRALPPGGIPGVGEGHPMSHGGGQGQYL
jgi:hypothetical protein